MTKRHVQRCRSLNAISVMARNVTEMAQCIGLAGWWAGWWAGGLVGWWPGGGLAVAWRAGGLAGGQVLTRRLPGAAGV